MSAGVWIQEIVTECEVCRAGWGVVGAPQVCGTTVTIDAQLDTSSCRPLIPSPLGTTNQVTNAALYVNVRCDLNCT
eukprot:3075961-Pyramimonas_sp.AAC.1